MVEGIYSVLNSEQRVIWTHSNLTQPTFRQFQDCFHSNKHCGTTAELTNLGFLFTLSLKHIPPTPQMQSNANLAMLSWNCMVMEVLYGVYFYEKCNHKTSNSCCITVALPSQRPLLLTAQHAR